MRIYNLQTYQASSENSDPCHFRCAYLLPCSEVSSKIKHSLTRTSIAQISSTLVLANHHYDASLL